MQIGKLILVAYYMQEYASMYIIYIYYYIADNHKSELGAATNVALLSID